MTPGSGVGAALIKLLVERHVAVTSTLPVFEDDAPTNGILPQRQLDLLSADARTDYLYLHALEGRRSVSSKAEGAKLWANELAMERASSSAGGLLLAGPDPTGDGRVLPGFGDQREIELLVAAGFSPIDAIRIGTLNGATYLGLADRIGSIEVGKDADLVLVLATHRRKLLISRQSTRSSRMGSATIRRHSWLRYVDVTGNTNVTIEKLVTGHRVLQSFAEFRSR